MEKGMATEKMAADMILKRGARVQMRAPLFLRLFGRKKYH